MKRLAWMLGSLALVATIIVGCQFKTTPDFPIATNIISSDAATSNKTYIDWDYIDNANEVALKALINDILDDPKFQPEQHKGCFRSWKGNWNCTNYGALLWIIKHTRRLDYNRGYEFIRNHVVHMTEYAFDWGPNNPKGGPQPLFHHKPGGEGVVNHPIWKQDLNRSRPGVPLSFNSDSDIARHVHLEGYAKLLRLLRTDPAFARKVGLTPGQVQRLNDMVFDWADNWYMKTDWNKARRNGTLFQYGRGMIPARGLLEMYFLTNEYKYLMAAEYIFMCTFYDLHRRVEDRDGNPRFFAYDSGYEGELVRGKTRTEKLLYYAAHFNMEPWQMGYMGEVAAMINYYTYNTFVKGVTREVILDISDWIVEQDKVPMGDLIFQGSQDFILTFLQGGNLGAVYNTPTNPMMTPLQALTLDPNRRFLPLCLLRSHLWDGGYYNTTLPNNKPRVQYPPRKFGPSTDHHLIFSWADVMLARFFITGKKNDLLWALWIYRDAKYFPNRSSTGDFRTLNKPDSIWYGGGNVSKTRGFAWVARGAMWSEEALRHFDRSLATQR